MLPLRNPWSSPRKVTHSKTRVGHLGRYRSYCLKPGEFLSACQCSKLTFLVPWLKNAVVTEPVFDIRFVRFCSQVSFTRRAIGKE